MPKEQPRSSRQRYRLFVEDYKQHRLDAKNEENRKRITADAESSPRPKGLRGIFAPGPGGHREYLRDYLRWLKPHRRAIRLFVLLALVAAGLGMIEPLFMRFIIDRVLLNKSLD